MSLIPMIMSGVAADKRKRRATVGTPAEGGGDVSPSLVVEYVDSSGTLQSTTVVDGVTSISGVAPFLIKLDARGSRSTVAGVTDEVGAVLDLGHRVNYGESLGTTWTYPESSSYSTDEDTGPPIFYRVFTTTGTKTVQYRCRNSLDDEATISFDVVVAASSTLTTVNLPVANGSWGTLVSSRRYTLDSGADYRSWGDPPTDGLHNVIFEKTGGGADPRIATFTPDNRSRPNASITRSAAIRTLNIDVEKASANCGVGFDHCYHVGGRVRQIDAGGSTPLAIYDDAANSTEANNVRYVRGWVLWNTGETNTGGGDSNYVFIGSADSFAMYGAYFNHNSGSGEHNLRGTFRDFVCRYSKINNTAASQHKTLIKIGGMEFQTSEQSAPDDWRSDDRVGDFAQGSGSGAWYGYPGRCNFFHNMQFAGAGINIPLSLGGMAPQNNDIDGTKEGLELCGIEDCVIYGTTPMNTEGGDDFDQGGRNMFVRNLRYNLGAGSYMPSSTNIFPNKIPTGWSTGYLSEDANTRPVPSAF